MLEASIDERGNRYDGYEFVIVQDIPVGSFSNVCPGCGQSLVLKCGRCGKTLPDASSETETP